MKVFMKVFLLKFQKIGKMKKLNKKWSKLFKIKQEANIAIEEKEQIKK